MKEKSKAMIHFENGTITQKEMATAQQFLKEYEYKEPGNCNWINYLKTEKNSIVIEPGAMCGWSDYVELFKGLCTLLSTEYPGAYFSGESDYVNWSDGFHYFMDSKFNENGLRIRESKICCDYCGSPIFGEDVIFMKNGDEGVFAFCSDKCKKYYLEEWDGDWEEATYEDYEEANSF
ncbi:MAG: hypothetical protein J6A42_01125 [Firmicutes bacterium]|nr:hypothetical protein [Bacillota bacterium]